MELIKSGLKTVLGTTEPNVVPSPSETIERLVERLETSTLLDDRRDACRAIRSLSVYRLEIGTQCMNVLVDVLKTDRNDLEIVSYILETLNSVISGPDEDVAEYPSQVSNELSEDLGVQFTEIFAKKKENVALILNLLEEYDFKVRWPCIKLVMGLLRNKLRDLQECILTNPMGVSRLMDLLLDNREIIRNDAILLLVHLTKGNSNIQKIVAFENAFDRLLEIIAAEGYSDGSVVVEDCLIVLQNLLRNNKSNQNFFKEGSYIQRLLPFVMLPSGVGIEWTTQKVTNLRFMLQIIRTLVSPTNPQQVTTSFQKLMHQIGLLQKLCNILLASGIPADILTETISTVSEVIRGNRHNQEYFSQIHAPTIPSRPVIVLLLMSMVNEKQPFDLRCAVLYCFQCLLYRNDSSQTQIIQTMLTNTNDVTAGQLLCGGLFSQDTLSNWFAAVSLSHALVDNKTQKEQLLCVQLAVGVNEPPVSLMKHCCVILQQQSPTFQSRIGFLIFLCTWLAECPLAVSHFVSIPINIPYLTSQVNLVEGDDLEILIQGLCAFLLAICMEFNDNSVPTYTREELFQLIAKRVGCEVLLEKFASIAKCESYSQAAHKPQVKYRSPDDAVLDYEFCRIYMALEGRISRSIQMKPEDLINGPESNMTEDQHKLLVQYKEVIRGQHVELTELRKELRLLKEFINENDSKSVTDTQQLASMCEQLTSDNERLKAQLDAASTECKESKDTIKTLAGDVTALQSELNELKQTSPAEAARVVELEEENKALKQRIEFLELQNIRNSNSTKEQLDKLKSERKTLCKEQEDLLVVLGEKESKLRTYRKMLRKQGQPVENDEDDDENDDDNYENGFNDR